MISLKINLRMLKKGLTQETLAGLVGTTQPTIHCVLSGERPGSRFVAAVAHALGVKETYFNKNDQPKSKTGAKK